MNKRTAQLFLCLMALALTAVAQSKNPATDEHLIQLEKSVPQLMITGEVPGLSIAVIRDAKMVWLKDFGVANSSTKQPVGGSTIFEAASLSKPVFAYGVLRLVEKGKLDLDAPLANYLPRPYVENDARVGRITARMVLSHTTGFPNWRQNQPLKTHFTPGERFSYSGEGFVYLQRVVEHLTGESLDAVMQREVFGPLGMTSTSFMWEDRYENLKATGHDSAGVARPRRQNKEANAAGSLHTTAADYSKFVIAIMNGTGLKKSSIDEMLKARIRVDEACSNCIANTPSGKLSTSIAWGLGWGLQQNNGIDSFWHWGDNNNDTHAFIIASRKQRSGIVIFTDSGNGHSIIPAMIEPLLGGKQPVTPWINYEGYDSPAKNLLRSIIADGVGPALSRYLGARPRDASLGLSELLTNRLGYALVSRKKIPEAIEVFKLNIKDHPASGNTYDSLAETYLEMGKKGLALEFYKKALEVEPNYPNAAAARKIIEDIEKMPKTITNKLPQ